MTVGSCGGVERDARDGFSVNACHAWADSRKSVQELGKALASSPESG